MNPVKEGQIWREFDTNRCLLVESINGEVATCFPMALTDEVWIAVGSKTLITVELLCSGRYSLETMI